MSEFLGVIVPCHTPWRDFLTQNTLPDFVQNVTKLSAISAGTPVCEAIEAWA